MLNYRNSVEVAINNFFLSDARRRIYGNLPEIIATDEINVLFQDAIHVYEECLVDFFNFYEINTAFLKNPVHISVEQFPWIFTYVFDNENHMFALDVNVNYDQMEVHFSIPKGRYTDNNVIYLDSIQDKHLRKLDIDKLPVSCMLEQSYGSRNLLLRESILTFKLKYEISYDLVQKLEVFNKFIDDNMPGLRDLLLS